MSVLDRIFAPLAFLAFAGFLGILIWFVPQLGLVAGLRHRVALGAYDFVRSIFIRRWRERR